MKHPHDHSNYIGGFQIVTGPPDDGADPTRGQETTVGGHHGRVIDNDPYGVKKALREGMHINPPGNPSRPRTPSPNDVVIQTNILNRRPNLRR